MAGLLMLFIASLGIVTASIRLEYKFYKNFGQKFIDYSGNGFDGINGGLLCQDKNDSLITDRGVMMTRANQSVMIPVVNSVGELLFNSNDFSIILLIKITQASTTLRNFFIRYIDEMNYFRIVHDNDLKVEYFSSTLYTFKHTKPCVLGKFHLGAWTFIGISISQSQINFYINTISQISSLPNNWNDQSAGASYLGSQTFSYESFQGYIFYTQIITGSLILTDYIGSKTSTCYRGSSCQSSDWDFSIIIDGSNYIISSTNTNTKDSFKNVCNSNCTNSCFNGLCLDCACEFLSCIIDSASIPCYCGSGITGSSTTCNCPSNTYFNGSTCQSDSRGSATCMFAYSSKVCYLCNDLTYVPSNKKCVCSNNCQLTTSCTSCESTCDECDKSECFSCKDQNAIVDTSNKKNCVCIEGYYLIEDSCAKCSSSCKSCINGSSCSSCIDHSSYNTYTGLCECDTGYYNDSSTSACIQCNSNCKSCNDANICLECKIKFSTPGNGNTCLCENDSELVVDECKCLSGTYRGNDNKCTQCPDDCLECEQSVTLNCTSCSSPLILDQGWCICPTGYFTNNNNECTQTCDTSLSNQGCTLQCGSKCKVCGNSKCEQCIDNSYLIDLYSCECSHGYDGDNCDRLKFSAEVSGFNNNSVIIKFQEIPADTLNDQNFFISNNSLSISFEIKYFSKSFWVLELLTDLIETSTFFIKISQIKSVSGAILFPEVYEFSIPFVENGGDESSGESNNDSSEGSLNESTEQSEASSNESSEVGSNESNDQSEDSSNNGESDSNEGNIDSNNSSANNSIIGKPKPDISSTTSSVANATTSITKGVITSSVAAAVASNPSSFWTLFNTLELISFLPLNGIPYPPKLRAFIMSLGSYSMVPIPSSEPKEYNSGPKPYKEAQEYGIDNSLFFVNSFAYLAIFTIFIAALPILFIGKTFGSKSIKEFCNKKIENYRFGFFIRYWIQGYLGFGMMTGVQIKSWNIREYFEIDGIVLANFCFSIIIISLISISPPLLIIFSWKKRNLIRQEDPELFKKYSTLFKELKNNSGLSKSIYYSIFLLRREFFIYSQLFLNDFLYFQGSINIAGCCISLFYMLIILPFKDKITFLAILIGEVFTLEVTILSLIFIENFEKELVEIVSDIIIYSILTMISFQFLISLYQLYNPIKSLIQVSHLLYS